MIVKDSHRQAARIVAVYAAASAAWIALSDHALLALVRSRALIERAETAKGFAFVAVTSILLYAALRRHFSRYAAAVRLVREVNRAYQMSASCESAIMRARSREELFEAVCRVAVDEGGYMTAWIGLAQDDARKSVLPVARVERDARHAGFVQPDSVVWSDEARGRGPTGTAIRTGRVVVLDAAQDHPTLAPWKDVVERLKVGAMISLPLKADGRTIGALTMYSERRNPFDPAETALLEKLAASISFALDHLAAAERERAQSATLHRLSQAVENNPLSITITDIEARIDYVNAKFTSSSGYRLEDVRGRRPWEIPLEILSDEGYAAIRETLSAGRVWRGYLRSRTKAGLLFWESAVISPVFDEAGAAVGHIAIKQDVTAQRALERAHRMTTACTAAIIRSRSRQELFDTVCRIAVEEGGYMAAWVGLAQDDAAKSVLPVADAGRDAGLRGLIKPGDAVWSDTPRGRGPTGTAIRTGAAAMVEDAARDPSTAPWRELVAAVGLRAIISLPLRAEGRTTGAFTLYTDRADPFDNEEKSLLEKLAASVSFALDNLARLERERIQLERLHMLSHAVENSPASIMITDARGNIEYVNRKFTETTGYEPDEVLGRNPRVLKSGETAGEEYARMWRTISAGETWHGEFHNRAKDGTLFWEWASISPLRDDYGRITHFVAVKEDITAKRTLESQLRQAQKMEAIGTLAGGIAHDFNNVLTVIQGHCSLLEASRAVRDGDRESVAEIQSSVERAAALTRQLLAFGRRQPMRATRVDVNESAAKMTRLMRRLVPERISLEAALSPAPLFARADATMLDQVLMNLVLNARDAIAAKGRILIETADAGAISPPAHVPPCERGWIAVRVVDDGGGIAEKDLPRIFEPFFTTKPVGKGTGLGLSVVDGIARQHKGWVTVASAAGRGADFTMYLPRAAAVEEDAAAGPDPAVLRGTETVLLAEDEAPLRRLVARALEEHGYRVLQAGDGESAADLWKRRAGRVSLLVTDMVMPGAFGGDELARRLRADDPSLRVIFISGYHASPAGGAMNLEKGAGFLQKPFKPDELARLARALLDGR